jgi:hypothetical protein
VVGVSGSSGAAVVGGTEVGEVVAGKSVVTGCVEVVEVVEVVDSDNAVSDGGMVEEVVSSAGEFPPQATIPTTMTDMTKTRMLLLSCVSTLGHGSHDGRAVL